MLLDETSVPRHPCRKLDGLLFRGMEQPAGSFEHFGYIGTVPSQFPISFDAGSGSGSILFRCFSRGRGQFLY